MPSTASTVTEYLNNLPDDRRHILQTVRDVINANLDADYEEGIQYGMIGWFVPHQVYPAGYHTNPKQPLPFAALASQKQYVSLHLMGVYCGSGEGPDVPQSEESQWFREAWQATGHKLDMGKACVRFKKLENVPLDVIGEAIRRLPAQEYIRRYEATLKRGR